MKILFLSNRTPYPPYRGDKLKIFHLAKQLTAKGHELHLLTFAQSEEDLAARPKLETIFTKVHLVPLPAWKSALHATAAMWNYKPVQVLYFRDTGMRRKLEEVLQEHFNAIHVQHLRMAPYLEGNRSIPRILDLPDAFSLYWERRKAIAKGIFQKWFAAMEAARVLRYERVINAYDLALTCSQEDLAYLRNQHDADNVRLLPNGVDLDTFCPRDHDYVANKTLLFTGNMDYAPNLDAVQYFVSEILPKIRKAHPEVRFVIAGQRPVEAVKNLANDYISVTGFVEDLAATYNAASVVVAPLRFGAGTQNKVLEAMAMGIPVVCSDIGFAGLGIISGQGAFMETDAERFAERVIQLLGDAVLRKRTGDQGIDIMRARFGWGAVARLLEGYFREVILQFKQ